MNDTAPGDRDQARLRRRDLVVAGACGMFVAGMVGMAYAAVPLYNWFCRTTGFAGTTQVAGTIAEVSQGANQTGAASSQLLSSAKQLSDSTTSLQSEIDGFLRSIAASA